MGVGTQRSHVVGGSMFCARFCLLARCTALVDSRFCAGMPPGMGLWLGLGGVIGVGTLRVGAGVVAISIFLLAVLSQPSV